MQLCTFSKSDILSASILPDCPLSLTAKASQKCPCRKRLYNVPPCDLRVLSCTFPETWQGEPIRNPEALAASLRPAPKPKVSKRVSSVTAIQRTLPMTTATATTESPPVVEANGAAKRREPAAQSTALAVRPQPAPARAFAIATLAQQNEFLLRTGQMIAQSGMFGNSVTAAQGFILAAACGGDLTKLLKIRESYHIISGNLTMKSDAMLARFETAFGGEFRLVCRTPDKAAIELKRARKTQLFEFTLAEAMEENYVYNKDGVMGRVPKKNADGTPNRAAMKDNWETPHKRMQMLWARVVSDAVRAFCPAVNCGTYTADEMGGDAPEVQHDDIVDAEFTITEDGEVIENGTATAAPSTNGHAAPTVETPAVSQPAAAPVVSSTPAAAAVVTPPPPATPTDDEQKNSLLKELRPLLDAMYAAGTLTKEVYDKGLQSRGVASARSLSLEKLSELMDRLRARNAKPPSDALSQMANRLAEGSSPGK